MSSLKVQTIGGTADRQTIKLTLVPDMASLWVEQLMEAVSGCWEWNALALHIGFQYRGQRTRTIAGRYGFIQRCRKLSRARTTEKRAGPRSTSTFPGFSKKSRPMP